MTTIRTVAAHEVVRAAHPRPVTERDEIGMAVGKAIDSTLAQYSYQFALARHPTATAMNRMAVGILAQELEDADLKLAPADQAIQHAAITGVLLAFRRSELMGLERPRSRLILINGEVGIYAQPDYWDRRERFYEMKSYHASPIPPDVQLQVELFQCAFPQMRGFLAWIDRHATPVTTTIEELPPIAPEERERILRLAYRTACEKGLEKVLEFIDTPLVPYTVPM